MTDLCDPIPRGTDGFYHPTSEEEIVCLVKQARRERRQLRVRGSAHSVARAIYTDPLDESENAVQHQRPPPSDHLNVMLDRYRGWDVVDEKRMLIEVSAGTHLGADPDDPTGTGAVEDSLLYQLFEQRGWTLSNLGGTTHQTVSGFTATGSAGSSACRDLAYALNIYGICLVDGCGNRRRFTRDDADPANFHAAVVSFGLLGVITKIILRCEPTYNIAGEERFTGYADCPVDLFGVGDGRPTLAAWLREREYRRMEWWPQRGGERVEVWSARREPATPGFEPKPYRQFDQHPMLQQFLCSLFLTVIGNLDDLPAVDRKLQPAYGRAREAVRDLLASVGFGAMAATALARSFMSAVRTLVGAVTIALIPFRGEAKRCVPRFFLWAMDSFLPLDRWVKFQDYAWHGIPMDAEADDVLMPVDFTEAWLPLGRAGQVMRLLREYFESPPDASGTLARTGTLSWEIYATGPTPFWMSPSYSVGEELAGETDEWAEGVVRIDPFWFGNNTGHPVDHFQQLWKLLRDNNVPFRLHWGKHQPVISQGDPDGWVSFFRKQYPRWDDFLKCRAKMDPHNVFLTSYWRERLGL